LDAFVSRLNTDLTSLLSSTFIGGSDHDVARAIAISPTDDVYITGWTASTGYPTTAGAYNETHSGNLDVFASKFNSTLSMLIASTFLGGTDGELANGIAIDWSGNIYVTGWTASSDFPTSDGSFDSTINGEQDVFVAHFDGGLSTLLASTFIGGVSQDAANAIALDSTGMVFVAGYTNSFDFIPYQVEGYDKTYHDSWDSFVYRQRPDLSKVNMLTVLLSGNGHGTVTSSPNGIFCGECPEFDSNCNQQEYNDCTEEYNREITVTLTAEASADSTFDAWAGGCDSTTTNPDRCIVTVAAIKTISATFKLRTVTITADYEPNVGLLGVIGTISPSGSVNVNYGGNQSFTITPSASYYIGDVIVDGVSQGPISTYTFTNVTSDRTIHAVFQAKPVINATANSGGSISPSGSVVVTYGGSMSFSITPNTGNYLADVVVDGISQGPITTYTFTNVISDRTIQAVFRPNPVITASVEGGGTTSPSGSATVAYHGNITFTMTPNAGNYLADVVVDGASKGPVTTYTFNDVVVDHAIRAVFRPNPVITVTANSGGTVSPSGTVVVNYGGSQSFTIAPDSSHYIGDVVVNGASVGALTTYQFTNVRADGTIVVDFRAKPVITASVEGGGTTSPSGSATVAYHGNITFTMTPNAGNYLADVVVDGTSKGSVTTYTFSDVVVDHAIRAVFRTNPVITASVEGDGTGTISPTGSVTANYHGSIRFMITADSSFNSNYWGHELVQTYAGSYVEDVLVDGVSVGPLGSYEFKDVTEDHTITVKFGQKKPPAPYTITATANSGGIIKPTGVINARPLAKKTFSIKPYGGYYISDVKIDGESKGPLSTYSFKAVAASHTIEAIFAEKKVLTVLKNGNGTVKSSPKGINCGKDCSEAFNTNASVILVAKPSKDSVFAGWSGGGCEGTAPTCVVTPTEDTTVIATFNLK
jgi:hypothetical protein